MKDQRYEPLREKAQELLLGISKLAGDKTISDDDLEEAVVEHVAAVLYWRWVDAQDYAERQRTGGD